MECLETQTLGHFLSLGLNGEVSICKSKYLESSLKTLLLKMMQKSGSLWEEVCAFIFPVKLPGMAESTTRGLLFVFSPIFALLCRLRIWVRFPQQGCNFCQAAQKNQLLNCGRSTRSPGRMFTQLMPFWKFALSKSGCIIWTSKVRRQCTWIPFR